MCNSWCLEFVERSLSDWPTAPEVLEVGARDVNGTARTVVGNSARRYVGVDLFPGSGVDRVMDAAGLVEEFGFEAFDIVIATEVLEHVEDWSRVLHQMLAVLRDGGLLVLTTRSPGFPEHDHPSDHWRFPAADLANVLAGAGEVLRVEDDMTLGFACGAGIVLRRKTAGNDLEFWRRFASSRNFPRVVREVPASPDGSLEGLPFDQYQRYRLIGEIVAKLRKRAPLHILDVGGSPATLKRFLPKDRITVADIADQGGIDLFADGRSLPFRDRSFDIVVASDTLEHVPGPERPLFLAETIRVAGEAVVIGAPFADPEVDAAEETLDALILASNGRRYPFLEEHRRYGLPDLEAVMSCFAAAGFRTAVLPNGYLPHWLPAIATFFLLPIPDPAEAAAFNARYNKANYKNDNAAPSYRKVLVAARTADLSGLESALTLKRPPSSRSDREDALRLSGELARNVRDAWKHGREAGIRDLKSRLDLGIAEAEEKDKMIADLAVKLAARDEGVEFLKGELSQATSGRGWKWLQAMKRGRERLMPSRTRRGRALNLWLRAGTSGFFRRGREKIRERLEWRRLGRYDEADLLSGPVSHRETNAFLSGLEINPGLLPQAAAEVTARPIPERAWARHDIVSFPIIDWSSRFQRPQQILSRFALEGHRIFYIHIAHFLPPGKGHRFQIREVAPNIYDVKLAANRPFDIYKEVVSGDLAASLLESLDDLRRAFEIEAAVSHLQVASWTNVAAAAREKWGWRILYDCMDEWNHFPLIGKFVLEKEKELVRTADLVSVTGSVLQGKWKDSARNLRLIRNAADPEFFASTAKSNDLLKGLRRPIVGYYGAIAEWFDIDLVRYLAENRPAYAFVLVGGIYDVNMAPLRRLPNVHLTGEKPYKTMPLYLHDFDACIIPFKKNAITDATDPVKLYEYLSLGKPVVATALEEIRGMKDLVMPAEDRDAFLAHLDEAVQERDPDMAGRRREFSLRNSWRERCREMEDGITRTFPRVSVIVVSHDNLAFTRLCLESVLGNADYPNVELVVVDNLSTDGTAAYLETLATANPNVRIILNDQNEGFARANNRGISSSSGDFIVLLNNDTIVPPGWLSRLLRPLRDPAVGLAGPMTNFVGNEARVAAPYRTWAEMERFAADLSRKNEGLIADIRMLAMFCTAMRRNVFDEIGPLDERFGLGMFEDDDYSVRIRKAGYRIVCVMDAFVHHFGMASFGKLLRNGKYNVLFEENRKAFEAKWDIAWEPHRNGALRAEAHFFAPAQEPPAKGAGKTETPATRDWLNRQFESNWEENGGPAQTRYFLTELVTHLPAGEKAFLEKGGPSVLDWGCAFGDGTDILATAFPRCRVAGLDISDTAVNRATKRYPLLEFMRAECIPRRFDVIVASNVLEHFPNPLTVVHGHLAKCRSLYIALVPFDESNLMEGHLVSFRTDSFPERLGGWKLLATRIFRTDSRFWHGNQMLVVYGSPEYAKEAEARTVSKENDTAAAGHVLRAHHNGTEKVALIETSSQDFSQPTQKTGDIP